jgi:hypothetical protein
MAMETIFIYIRIDVVGLKTFFAKFKLKKDRKLVKRRKQGHKRLHKKSSSSVVCPANFPSTGRNSYASPHQLFLRQKLQLFQAGLCLLGIVNVHPCLLQMQKVCQALLCRLLKEI